MAEDRHSVAETPLLLTDPDEIALREAENGIRQFDLALEIIRSFVKDNEKKFIYEYERYGRLMPGVRSAISVTCQKT